ncbi:WD40 repeat-like protein [Dacryopinax primogenitus]|uniref:WD40 repeat-like protein n=1 Tax=Dacryopinax primogenitus (strain DJM 731) TaxID=1858805 RepID=M5FU37_DACPD|nr:WD40 repeat-like protein [Dacryopinax primogenitus]EJU01186.1 WD40 repeat-like protein [Dacryopinax primogenitus]
MLDPAARYDGFRELEAWVDGSLDIYRPEFTPLLFPVFVHFYLDLIQLGLKDSAVIFYAAYSPRLLPTQTATLHHLSTLLLPVHLTSDETALRFRKESYRLRMSKSGFALFVGWLTDGMGGTGGGVGDSFGGEKGRRGRDAVLRVINAHLKIDVAATTSALQSQGNLEETTGLVSSLVSLTIPGTSSKSIKPADPQSFNAAQSPLKLGKPPLDLALREEVDRAIKEIMEDASAMDLDRPKEKPQDAELPTVAPEDMPPLPPSFREVDVRREVAKVSDERKRIRLDPTLLQSSANADVAPGRKKVVALPSICMYTLHDVPDGNVPCATFSQDSSLLATGFEQSYIRLWNLKGEKIRGLRSDFDLTNVREARDLRRIRDKAGSITRKLIGHSGPVYSVSFDPLAGSSGPPHWLLSSSADATIRLWSLDLLANVVVYRGHESPVWDVQWGPLGTYFASGSRDRTARLWCTERLAPLRVFAGHLNDVDIVRFHPNSLYLATGSSDWTARLWDIQRGACVRVFVGHQGGISAMAFSPDGRYLATGSDDLSINLWDLHSGRRIKKMTGHNAAIHSLTFSAESNVLLSGGADWTVRCWDVKSAGGNATSLGEDVTEKTETSDLLATLPTKRTPVVNVQFTPRNMVLATGPIQPTAAPPAWPSFLS